MAEALFDRIIGIDYSGARTPDAGLPGLRVYVAEGAAAPVEVAPPPSRRRLWTRRGLAAWLVTRLGEEVPTLVGIDHAFSFPQRYFERYRLAPDWDAFLDDFCRHWPTDESEVWVDLVREGRCGDGRARCGDSRWRRVAEIRAGGAKSVFHFDVPGSVAKSTHAGLPWLRFIRRALPAVHFWPYDGWRPAPGRSVVAEVYPALWSAAFPRDGRNPHQHDAYAVAARLSGKNREGTLTAWFDPELGAEERALAQAEGWILGRALRSTPGPSPS